MKKIIALILCVVGMLACGSVASEEIDPIVADEVGQTEQAVQCPQNVYCPGTPAYSWSAGSNIACFYNPGGIKYVAKPSGCQECCPTWGYCTPGGCGGQHYPFVVSWTCRTGGSCSP